MCRHVTTVLHPGLYRLCYVSLTTGNVLDMYKSIAWELGLPTERSRATAYRAIRTEVTRLVCETKCCFPLYLVRSPSDLTGLFGRRISWDDGAIRETSGGGEVAFLMNDCCCSGEDVVARAPSVGKGWASAAHLSMPCPHAP